MTINNKSERNYRGKCLGWPVTSYGAGLPSDHFFIFFCELCLSFSVNLLRTLLLISSGLVMTSAMLIVRVFSQVCCSTGLVDSGLRSCDDSVTAITHTENHLISQQQPSYNYKGRTIYSSHNEVSDRLVYHN